MKIIFIPLEMGLPTFGPYYGVKRATFINNLDDVRPNEIALVPSHQLSTENCTRGVILPANKIYSIQVEEEK